MFQTLLESTSFANIIAITSLIATIVLSLYAIRQAASTKKYSLFCFKINAVSIIDRKHTEPLASRLKIEFDGVEVERLSAAEIFIWNAGNAVLEGESLVLADPVRIQTLNGGRIVEAVLIKNPSPGCAITVERVEDEAKRLIRFDYLNPGDGAVIRVLHTSESSDLQVLGALKGSHLEDYLGGPEAERVFELRKKVALGYTKIAMAIFVISALWQSATQRSSSSYYLSPPSWLPITPDNFTTLVIMVGVMGPLFLWVLFPGVKKKSLPRSLD